MEVVQLQDYVFANLSDEDLNDITVLEHILGARHGKSVVLVAYTKQGGAASEILEEDELASLLDWQTGMHSVDMEPVLTGARD